MDTRQYLDLVRRQWRLIALVTLLGLILGAVFHLVRTPVYEATAQVLLQPNDPAERVDGEIPGGIDLDSYAAVQISVITARDVAARAAESLDLRPKQVQDAVTVVTGDSSSVLEVTASSTRPAEARDIANALVKAFIDERRETQVAALTRAADEIDTQLADLNRRITALQDVAAGGSRPAALSAAFEQFSTLTIRQSELRVEATLKRGEARVLADATRPAAPIGTSLPVDVILGGLLGAMIGLGLVFARNQLDDRVRGRDELERLTDLPVLAELPVDKTSSRVIGHVATQDDPLGSFAEAARSLRTSVTFLGVDEPVRRIMVTSGVPGEGKTMVAVNLATAFAQAGVRTVLVSADLRRSRLEEALGLDPYLDGLSTVLVSDAAASRRVSRSLEPSASVLQRKLGETLVDTSVPGLTLLPAGPHPPNPAELLGSHHMDDVLNVLDGLFDLVVIDTSPVLPVTDAATLAPKAERVLVVASTGITRRRALERTLSVLGRTQTEVLGVVLNRAEVDSDLGSGGYYSRQPDSKRIRPRAPGRAEPALMARD